MNRCRVSFLLRGAKRMSPHPLVRHFGLASDKDSLSLNAYWRRIPAWSDVTVDEFINYNWQTQKSVNNSGQLLAFMKAVLPNVLPPTNELESSPRTADELLDDVQVGIRRAPMAVRLTPHLLSLIEWSDPLHDPIFRQFIPLGSRAKPDHPKLTFDSLDEIGDSPVYGLIHRYPDRAAFLAISVCPVYCRNCTRSHTVGSNTEIVSKKRFLPIYKKWEVMFNYVERTPAIADMLVTGGDTYSLSPDQMRMIGTRMLSIPHVRRLRFASKGVSFCPGRIIDPEDEWADVIIDLTRQGRKMGKSVALHTHFNHPNEVTWITRRAAQRLFEEGVTVRNQSVFLNGVNNDVDTMKSLIDQLSSMNIQPYYVFQCDMVRGIEDMRTPLHEILQMESAIRGWTSGFMTPNFVVNLPGGGGKRLACSYESYDRVTGRSTFLSPGSKYPSRSWEYWDPL
ncbi:kama family protein [Hypoxylon sp. FL1857]|nr:kama family protein [Hypoxylon sp. FL1857]